MLQNKRTEIASLGEFGLIHHLTADYPPTQASTLYGPGDDCAVIRYGNGACTLVTSDMLMEGIHFDLTYVSMELLGYKAAMVNLSDIYAMNGTPRQMIVSIALSKRFSVEDIDSFYAGLRRACHIHHVDVVGGDTTSSLTGLAISITCLGEATEEQIVYRNGAKPDDLICVTGDLGAAYMGLQLLEREKTVYHQQLQEAVAQGKKLSPEMQEAAQPDFSGREYLLERQLRPEARGDMIEALAKHGIKPTSMIDISDGLSSELLHICTQSHVGCRIFEERIPLDYQTAVMAEELNMNVTTCALNGGEDYELLFTVPLSFHEKITQIEGIKLIGHITSEENGCTLVCRDGAEFPLQAQGWNPLKKEEETIPNNPI